VTAGTTSSEGRARAIERFFHANFTYSLEADLSGPGHPLALLVRQRRPAYCIYFAGAMAAMLRSLGIPARMIGGFVVEEPNALTGRALVRERDAHAWVEAWIPEQGRYFAFDPTPFDSRGAALGLERQGRLGALLDAAASSLRRAWAAAWRDPLGALASAGRSPLSWIPIAGALAFWLGRRRWSGLSRREE
jgi:transglutaminase-like putative cysteine protease